MSQAYDQNGNYVGGGSAPDTDGGPRRPGGGGGHRRPGLRDGDERASRQHAGILAQIASDLQTGTTASLANVQGTDAQAL